MGRLRVLGLRATAALTGVGALAVFAVSGWLAGLLPHSWWFVVVFVPGGIAILLVLQRIARRFNL